jgi:Tachylectin
MITWDTRIRHHLHALAWMIVVTQLISGQLHHAQGTPFGDGSPPPPIVAACSQARLSGLPQFLSAPKGSAKYPFEGICTNKDAPSAHASFRLEGSWTPSETDPNKPNASESVRITQYESFLPERQPGGEVFMYWTARCTRDPWLEPALANCRNTGASIPEDVGRSFPDLQSPNFSFPLSGRILSASDRQRLLAEYIRMNPPIASAPRPGGIQTSPDSPMIPNPIKTFLYAITPNGTVKWYRHNGALDGAGLSVAGSWTGPVDITRGWDAYPRVFSGGPNMFYGIDPKGNLQWLRHDGIDNGIPKWLGPTQVGNGWLAAKHVFSAGPGIIYMVDPTGNLFWYKHQDSGTGGINWSPRTHIGEGWQNFTKIFGGCNGVIYAVQQDGALRWYKHAGWTTGERRWMNSTIVDKNNWNAYRQIIATCGGLLYTVAQDGTLQWRKHLGVEDGSDRWDGPKTVGRGWQGFSTILAAKYGQ